MNPWCYSYTKAEEKCSRIQKQWTSSKINIQAGNIDRVKQKMEWEPNLKRKTLKALQCCIIIKTQHFVLCSFHPTLTGVLWGSGSARIIYGAALRPQTLCCGRAGIVPALFHPCSPPAACSPPHSIQPELAQVIKASLQSETPPGLD